MKSFPSGNRFDVMKTIEPTACHSKIKEYSISLMEEGVAKGVLNRNSLKHSQIKVKCERFCRYWIDCNNLEIHCVLHNLFDKEKQYVEITGIKMYVTYILNLGFFFQSLLIKWVFIYHFQGLNPFTLLGKIEKYKCHNTE